MTLEDCAERTLVYLSCSTLCILEYIRTPYVHREIVQSPTTLQVPDPSASAAQDLLGKSYQPPQGSHIYPLSTDSFKEI